MGEYGKTDLGRTRFVSSQAIDYPMGGERIYCINSLLPVDREVSLESTTANARILTGLKYV